MEAAASSLLCVTESLLETTSDVLRKRWAAARFALFVLKRSGADGGEGRTGLPRLDAVKRHSDRMT